jgi:hypothetical protein
MGVNALVECIYKAVPPNGEEAPQAGAAGRDSEEEFRRQVASLARSLLDMLKVAETSGDLSDTAALALESARRIAEDIRRYGPAEQERLDRSAPRGES